ncbi:sorting nexin-21 [Latimeria chalumnae]|uniref:Sorting nexin family member 21 n=1 Tax=Latimeria chalumnae TaxID=7897 RepID=H3BHA4_LATCH|nr:PREDICTED: sorting nexin-21 [Latimeria chalumnae]|eukprot:XP_005986763.1 PREDICTED: sorting nexin-21 [Latimeria chalumnae]
MASKILHRIRRSIGKDDEVGREGAGSGLEEVEEFPESSELDDDTEGLSTRLSGTLSFNSSDLTCETEEVSVTDSDAEHQWESSDSESESQESSVQEELPHCQQLTRQLQESWKKSRVKIIPDKLVFEVTNASVVQDGSSKYVLYTIHLIKFGCFDKTPAIITRRYTDLKKLNEKLRKLFKSDMEDICFPKKKLRRNFAAETIAKRSRGFEQYLSHLHSIPEIRHSKVFMEFFYLDYLKAGQKLLQSGIYSDAVSTWSNALCLQDKLGSRDTGHQLHTLAALTVCHQELEQLEEAQSYCEKALQLIRKQEGHHLLVPLLQVNIRLSWKIAKDKRQSEAYLQQLQENGVDIVNQLSLKECLIMKPLV